MRVLVPRGNVGVPAVHHHGAWRAHACAMRARVRTHICTRTHTCTRLNLAFLHCLCSLWQLAWLQPAGLRLCRQHSAPLGLAWRTAAASMGMPTHFGGAGSSGGGSVSSDSSVGGSGGDGSTSSSGDRSGGGGGRSSTGRSGSSFGAFIAWLLCCSRLQMGAGNGIWQLDSSVQGSLQHCWRPSSTRSGSIPKA